MGLVDLAGYTYSPNTGKYVKAGSPDQSVNWMNVNASNTPPMTDAQLADVNKNARVNLGGGLVQMRGIGGQMGVLNTNIDPTKKSTQQSIADWYKSQGMDVNNGGALDNPIYPKVYSKDTWRRPTRPDQYGQAGQSGQNGFSNLANQQMPSQSQQTNPMMQLLQQLTGYVPSGYLNQTGDQSLNVMQLNSLLNPQSGMGIQANYGGAGGGLPNYFGNGWGMGIGEYTQQFNQADLQSSLGDLSQYGGIGGSITERLNKLYNPYGNRSIPDMTADYLEYAAPRYQSGWNLYGMSPALEGLLNTQNQNPHNYNANWAGQGQSGIIPYQLQNMIANAYPRTAKEWEDGGWRDFYPPPSNYKPLDSMVMQS